MASLVVIAYTVACVGLVRKWSEVKGLFKSTYEGIRDENGVLYPSQTLNRRQRIARDRLAKLKASTFREAVYVYVVSIVPCSLAVLACLSSFTCFRSVHSFPVFLSFLFV